MRKNDKGNRVLVQVRAASKLLQNHKLLNLYFRREIVIHVCDENRGTNK